MSFMPFDSHAWLMKQQGYTDTVPVAQRRKSAAVRPGRCTNPITQSLFLQKNNILQAWIHSFR